jgi:HSP20 family protein
MIGLLKHEEQPAQTTSPTAARRSVSPRCDIHENETAVILIADMPGVVTDGVTVQVHGDVLTMSGRSSVSEPERSTALWREYATRDYERAFRLGQAVDADHITAVIKDGVLRVELPKRASTSPHRITVQAG